MIELSLILLCLLMFGGCAFLGIALNKETKARTAAEENAKYWRTVAHDNGSDKSKYYVALRECYEQANKLSAFICLKYHG